MVACGPCGRYGCKAQLASNGCSWRSCFVVFVIKGLRRRLERFSFRPYGPNGVVVLGMYLSVRVLLLVR